MPAPEMNNLDGLLGPEEQNAAARRGYSRAAAAARTARGGGGGGSRGEDEAEARRMAILKNERRRAAAMAQKPNLETRAAAPERPAEVSKKRKPVWRRVLDLFRR